MNSTSKFSRLFLPICNYPLQCRSFYNNRKITPKPKPQNNNVRIHLVDAEAIKFTVDSISSDWSKEKALIVDTSPGPGLLLEALLKAGAPKVRGLLHSSSPYRSVLQTLQESYPDRLELRDFDFNYVKNNFDESRGFDDFNDVFASALATKLVTWKDEPPLKLILTLTPHTERIVLRRLITELTLQTGIYAQGPSQIFAFISKTELNFMKTRPRFLQPAHILYPSFFHIELLKKFTYECLHPVITNRKTKKAYADDVYLVSLVPKPELYDLLPTKDWPDYYYFVKQTMARKKNQIINFMERLVPDCGLKLIRKGVTVHKTFEDLSPDEFIQLFLEVKSWPEFEVSNLATATKEYLTANELCLLQEGSVMNKKETETVN